MMKIGELAQRTGLTASRIRFYETRGLIHGVSRTAKGYREYTSEVLLTLEIITSAQQAGFSLDEIQRLLPPKTQGWQHQQFLDVLQQKVLEIEALQQRLDQSLMQLRSLIHTVENRPEGISCEDNAQRVIKQFQR